MMARKHQGKLNAFPRSGSDLGTPPPIFKELEKYEIPSKDVVITRYTCIDGYPFKR